MKSQGSLRSTKRPERRARTVATMCAKPKVLSALAAVLAIIVVASLPSVAAAKQPTAPAKVSSGRAPSTKTAVIRGAHFSPNTPGVDVYLRSFSGKSKTLWLSNIGYGDVSGYRRIKPGFYTVSMRKHGAPANSPAGLSWTVHARPGKAYTVAAVGMNAHLKGIVLRDRLSTPRKGNGLVRVIQAANRTPHAMLIARPHHVLAKHAAFASTTNYRNVPAGRWTVEAKGLSANRLTATKHVSIHSASVNSLVVLDSKKGIQLRVLRDASGAAVAPRGAVDAGGGGLAPNQPIQPGESMTSTALAVYGALGLLLLVASGSASIAFRRHRRVEAE